VRVRQDHKWVCRVFFFLVPDRWISSGHVTKVFGDWILTHFLLVYILLLINPHLSGTLNPITYKNSLRSSEGGLNAVRQKVIIVKILVLVDLSLPVVTSGDRTCCSMLQEHRQESSCGLCSRCSRTDPPSRRKQPQSDLTPWDFTKWNGNPLVSNRWRCDSTSRSWRSFEWQTPPRTKRTTMELITGFIYIERLLAEKVPAVRQ